MTVSQPENNNYPWGFGALHKTSHTDVLRRSRAVNDEAKYKQAWCSCRADVLLIKGGFICSIPVKPSHSIAGIWGPVHMYPDIYFFFKSEVCLSILAFRPHVIGIFGRRRRRFSQMVQRVKILENDVRIDEYRGFRIRHCACSVNGCYRISVILAFLCGRAKKIQIRFVWTRISDRTFFLTSRGIKTM